MDTSHLYNSLHSAQCTVHNLPDDRRSRSEVRQAVAAVLHPRSLGRRREVMEVCCGGQEDVEDSDKDEDVEDIDEDEEDSDDNEDVEDIGGICPSSGLTNPPPRAPKKKIVRSCIFQIINCP